MAITIKHQTAEHAQGLFLALQDKRIYQFLDDKPPNSIEALRGVIERRMRGAPASTGETWLNWTVFEDDTVVGYTQATIAEDGKASLAYVLSPTAWGRSVAYTACIMTMAEIETSASVTEFMSDTEKKNILSQALLERLGFIRRYEDENNVYYKRTLSNMQ